MARPSTAFSLPAADQAALEAVPRTGCRPVRAVRRAQALLALATGQGQHQAAKAVGRRRQTGRQGRQRYEQGGWQAALAAAPRSGTPPRFAGPPRAARPALAGTPAPTGHGRWRLGLLAEQAVERGLVAAVSHETVSHETVSHETVGQGLKKTKGRPSASSTGAWGR